MISRKTRSLLTTLIVILGSGVVAFIFWTSDKYRAATPLVFIFGALVLLVPAIGNVIKMFASPKQKTVLEARSVAKEMHANEDFLWRNHIPQLITNLYFRHIENYPQWIRESRDYVPSSVTNAGRTDEGWVRLLLYFADYIFPYQEWSLPAETGSPNRQAVLEVVREGVRMITLRLTRTTNKSGLPQWEPIAIEGFHPGDWIRDFQNLKAEILAIIKDREREAREN